MVDKLSPKQLAQLNSYLKAHPKTSRQAAIRLLFDFKSGGGKTRPGSAFEHSVSVKPTVRYLILKTKKGNVNVNQTLAKRINGVYGNLKKAEKSNGFIGKGWSGFKNLTGIGDSSDKVREQLKQEKKLLDQFNTNPQNRAKVFQQLTGHQYSNENLEKFVIGKIKLKSERALNGYKEGQEMAVDVGADIVSGIASVGIYTAAIAAAPVTGGASIVVGLAAAATSGAAIKTGLKAADAVSGGRKYKLKDAGHDAATGAFSGVLAPVTGGMGGAVGKTVATKLGVQAIKTVGKEVAEEVVETGVKQGLKQGIKTALANPAGYEYVGGSIAKRGVAMAAEMASDGAVGGATDNAFRTALDGGSLSDVAQAAGEGFVGGAIMSPLIGGGFKAAGKAGHELGSKVKGGNEAAADAASASGSKNYPSLSEIDKIARHDEINQANLSPHRFSDVSNKKAQKQVGVYLDALLEKIPKNTTEANIGSVKKYADFILPDGTVISRNHAGDTGIPVFNPKKGTYEVPDVDNAVLFWIKDIDGNEHVLPALTPENVSKAKRLIQYMSTQEEIPRNDINKVQQAFLENLKKNHAADVVETSVAKNADDIVPTPTPQGAKSEVTEGITAQRTRRNVFKEIQEKKDNTQLTGDIGESTNTSRIAIKSEHQNIASTAVELRESIYAPKTDNSYKISTEVFSPKEIENVLPEIKTYNELQVVKEKMRNIYNNSNTQERLNLKNLQKLIKDKEDEFAAKSYTHMDERHTLQSPPNPSDFKRIITQRIKDADSIEELSHLQKDIKSYDNLNPATFQTWKDELAMIESRKNTILINDLKSKIDNCTSLEDLNSLSNSSYANNFSNIIASKRTKIIQELNLKYNNFKSGKYTPAETEIYDMMMLKVENCKTLKDIKLLEQDLKQYQSISGIYPGNARALLMNKDNKIRMNILNSFVQKLENCKTQAEFNTLKNEYRTFKKSDYYSQLCIWARIAEKNKIRPETMFNNYEQVNRLFKQKQNSF